MVGGSSHQWVVWIEIVDLRLALGDTLSWVGFRIFDVKRSSKFGTWGWNLIVINQEKCPCRDWLFGAAFGFLQTNNYIDDKLRIWGRKMKIWLLFFINWIELQKMFGCRLGDAIINELTFFARGLKSSTLKTFISTS